MAKVFRLSRTFNINTLNLLKKYAAFPQVQATYIHTSKKTKDITLVDSLSVRKPGDKPEEPFLNRTPENWVSYGFCDEDIREDTTWCHIFLFFSISCLCCGWVFNIMYSPDSRMIDWVKREAFIELRRREVEGLPLVNKDLVPIANIELPSDDDLGEAEIII